ncbi:pseudouridine synthase [Patellaria atrata CBS 101060]|uniref:Pseudouridine synthase n=1 Tax=Patellaria atrata CBS 101060 TaxID=1346257 RepID=A0A9P4VS93_9PEZI|nr:pseudouridine synthase [Patellaria atrata CBS 101060]
MAGSVDYQTWDNTSLIARIIELESRLAAQNAGFAAVNCSNVPPPKQHKPPKPFDPSKYSTRFIALKFAYLGQNYNGYEHHVGNDTPLPTIEEVLWRALTKTRLILPKSKVKEGENNNGTKERSTRMNIAVEQRLKDLGLGLTGSEEVNWEGCEYSKCGRTDRGVSAFGQVIGIRVRSNRPLPRKNNTVTDVSSTQAPEGTDGDSGNVKDVLDEPAFDPIKDEIPYILTLNRVLPPDIRVLAWCPNPSPDFSARFSCRERRYRYFFTNPAFAPSPGVQGLHKTLNGKNIREGWLDIAAMREAASYLVGLHDFRNFCKVDPTKQITNFERRVFHADITEVTSLNAPAAFLKDIPFSYPSQRNEQSSPTNVSPLKLYTFDVNGSAFLWHQVRHLIAILILVGQGLESPSIVKELLDIEKCPTKPKYEMAVDAPLVLWDCIFPAEGPDSRKDALDWIYAGEQPRIIDDGKGGEIEKYKRDGLIDNLWEVWRQKKIDEVLAGSLLDVVAAQGSMRFDLATREPPEITQRITRAFYGGNISKSVGSYVPVMKKPRMDSVEVINARYAERRGLNKDPDILQQRGDSVD